VKVQGIKGCTFVQVYYKSAGVVWGYRGAGVVQGCRCIVVNSYTGDRSSAAVQ